MPATRNAPNRKRSGLKITRYGKDLEKLLGPRIQDNAPESDNEVNIGQKRKRQKPLDSAAQPSSNPRSPQTKAPGSYAHRATASVPRAPGPSLGVLARTTSKGVAESEDNKPHHTRGEYGFFYNGIWRYICSQELARRAIRSVILSGSPATGADPKTPSGCPDGLPAFKGSGAAHSPENSEMADEMEASRDMRTGGDTEMGQDAEEGWGSEPGSDTELGQDLGQHAGTDEDAEGGQDMDTVDDMQEELGNGFPQPYPRPDAGLSRATNTQAERWEQDDKYVCKPAVKHRPKDRNALLGYMRSVLAGKLGWDEDNEGDLLPPTAPPEVAAPTARSFYIRWEETESSLFNATAARIVVDLIWEDLPHILQITTFDELLKDTTQHIGYLRTVYKEQNDAIAKAKKPSRLRRCSARTRKATLYAHRLRVINELPGLGKHGRLIQTLGTEGTSSDEESPLQPGVYIIRRRKELSPAVKHLKNQLDQAYRVHFKGPGSKGSQVRKRVDQGVVSKRRFNIKGLPTSCIDPAWLTMLTDLQKQMFEFEEFDYDFSFPQELLESL